MGNANAYLTISRADQDFVRDVTNRQMVPSAVGMPTEYFDILQLLLIK